MHDIDIVKIGGWVIAVLAAMVAMLFRNGLLKRLEYVETGQERLQDRIADIRSSVARMEGKLDSIKKAG